MVETLLGLEAAGLPEAAGLLEAADLCLCQELQSPSLPEAAGLPDAAEADLAWASGHLKCKIRHLLIFVSY